MKIMKFAERGCGERQKDSTGEHLRSGAHDFGIRERQLAR
jgi:hypothetical protein